MFLLSCCCLVRFGVVLPMFLHTCWVFCSRKCLTKILFFLGLVSEIHFRERTFVLVVLLLPVFFGAVLPMFLHTCWVFCSRKCLTKILLFLGLVFEIPFRERTFVLVVLLLPCAFRCCFAYVFYLFVGLFDPKRLGKNSRLLRFGL